MSDKPILVTLSRGNSEDFVKFTDSTGLEKQRMGLVRCVPMSLMDKTFHELTKYICDPAGADGNPPYQGKEHELALIYLTEYVESAQGFLYPQRGGVILRKEEDKIKYTDLVSSQFGRIVEHKTLETAAGPMDCKGLDLILEKELFGGYGNIGGNECYQTRKL